ncbi:MAG TPA: type II toxin-antitoxin system VapC family toxin [Mycobacteriales bacterium]|nr:type II toxin-antitoxin system VapC family toxin [Mycobacteriales bacterium]
MIVVDASAALSALLNAGEARAALGRQQIHVPHLIDAEIAGALRRRVVTGDVAEGAGLTALRQWRKLGLTRYTGYPLLERIWELRHNMSAYDATYIALAETLGTSLLTADRRLGRAPGARCPITLVPR